MDKPLYLQLYTYYKNAIMQNQMKAYTKMPSIRELAQKHNLSKTTIEKAYNQLLIEGFIQSQPKSGHYVLPIQHQSFNRTATVKPKIHEPSYQNIAQPKQTFHLDAFKRAINHVIHNQTEALYHPPKTSGEPLLKDAIITHLRHERGVKANSDQVLIDSGMQTHLKTLGNMTNKRRLGYLIPLFHQAKKVFELLNFQLIPFTSLDKMLNATLDFIYISPSNLYPSGEVIGFNERVKLIDYAKKADAYIIEDDYNYIYRHNAYQIPSIQSLSNGEHVIYIGSFTRQLLPSLRLSYMVLPPSLMIRYQKREPLSQNVSTLDQLVIAHFIQSGAYQKHLRKLSSFSKKQNELMRKTLLKCTHPAVTYSGLESNLHVLFTLEDQNIKSQLIQLFNEANWFYRFIEEWPNTLLLPYHGFLDDDFLRLQKWFIKIESHS